MLFYPFILILHILFAIIWMGGSFATLMLGVRAHKGSDAVEIARVVENAAFLFPRILVPASIGALLCGLVMTWLAWSFLELWIILGLIGWALAGFSGGRLLGPRAEQFLARVSREGISPAILPQGRQIFRIMQFDLVLLALIVTDMVLKPAPDDVVTLVVMGVILAAAIVYLVQNIRSLPKVA